jgi:hypothetical protein
MFCVVAKPESVFQPELRRGRKEAQKKNLFR